MDTTEFERRLRALARREGLTFGTFATLRGADREVLVATIVRGFEAGAVYREPQVNVALKRWLAGPGAMVETDHVNIRRWLVDAGVLTRTADCAEYRLSARGAEIAADALERDTARIDPAAIVARTRRDAAEARARRKAEWLAREGSPVPPRERSVPPRR